MGLAAQRQAEITGVIHRKIVFQRHVKERFVQTAKYTVL
jgi:hypothetical protein